MRHGRANYVGGPRDGQEYEGELHPFLQVPYKVQPADAREGEVYFTRGIYTLRWEGTITGHTRDVFGFASPTIDYRFWYEWEG